MRLLASTLAIGALAMALPVMVAAPKAQAAPARIQGATVIQADWDGYGYGGGYRHEERPWRHEWRGDYDRHWHHHWYRPPPPYGYYAPPPPPPPVYGYGYVYRY
jgi:hypothetical protein